MNYSDLTTQIQLLIAGTRQQQIDWLQWNDPNGEYSDTDARANGLPPWSDTTIYNLMLNQVATNSNRETIKQLLVNNDAEKRVLVALLEEIEDNNQQSVFDTIIDGTPALVFDVCQHIGIPCLDKHGEVVESIEQADNLTIEDINREYVIKHICDNMLADTVRKWLNI